MNTIEYVSNGQSVQFSKKAVNIDGKDFAYTGMSAIKHSSSRHLYLFKYDGNWQKLCYNESDERNLQVLFSRIAELNARRAEALKAKVKEITEPESTKGTAPVAESSSPYAPTALNVKSIFEERRAEVPPDETSAEAIVGSSVPHSERTETLTAETSSEENRTEIIPPEERKFKLRKAIIIFIAVLVLFAVLSVICLFAVGPSSDPIVGPNSDETQQYEDIDGLIKDLQKN